MLPGSMHLDLRNEHIGPLLFCNLHILDPAWSLRYFDLLPVPIENEPWQLCWFLGCLAEMR